MWIKLVVYGLDGLLTIFSTAEPWQRSEGDQTEQAERGLRPVWRKRSLLRSQILWALPMGLP